MNKTSFFRRSDWIAFGFTFLISLTVYVLTLQPTVGLEDSGELIVASDYLGVPHPPGYPIWSLLTWFFQWIFHTMTFHGYPNPAWAVNFFSAFAGAFACGTLAMLVSSSGMKFVRGIKTENDVLGENTESLFCCTAGIAAGLLLAFSQGLWSQSVIAEVYSLNILFQTLMLLFLYRWMCEPSNPKPLFLTAFVYGLGMTNHQTILFMGLAVALAIFLRDIRLGRDFSLVGLFYVLMIVINKFGPADWAWNQGWDHPAFWFWSVYAVIIPILGLFLPNGKTVCATYLLMLVGLSFYLYMPFASDQNPPINWGYPRTWQGFMHAITRGQYQKVVLVDVLNDPGDFILKAQAFFRDLKSQFLLPLVFTGLLPFTGWQVKTGRRTFHMFVPAAILVAIGSLLSLEDQIFPEPTTVFYTLMSIIGLLLTLLVTAGLSIIALNFVQKVYNEAKSFGSNFMDWLAMAVVAVLGLGAAFALLFVDFRLLMSLGAHDYPPAMIMIILGSVIVPIAVVAMVLLLRRHRYQVDFDIRSSEQHWVATTLVAFIGVGLIFVILQNPKLDLQTQFIARVQYIQSHAIYALWIGYGILLLMAGVQTVLKNNRNTKWIGTFLVLLLPAVLLAKNFYNDEQEKVVGGSEQNGHWFGWQFGNWALQGAQGIKKDLWYECGQDDEKFAEAWAQYPNPDYPPPMGTNAVFFGGTDPGRFVPTYMIYCPQVRPDVYLITQNALADNTYMAVMRDLYGDQIWIPAQKDNNLAFQEYVEGVKSGRINAGADVNTEDGRVQVQGVQGVMQINGILCRQIFDHNQFITEAKTDESTRQSGAAVVPRDPLKPDGNLRRRDFYVEESYAIAWMYPYLTPHGLILKLNNEPTPITPEMIKNDRDFWTWNTERLVNDPKFIRDIVARKSFSKLRTALAGLYAARGKLDEAEYAFKQAIKLYPLSPEAVFRLGNLYMQTGQYQKAREVLTAFGEEDVYNERVVPTIKNIDKIKEMNNRRIELEALFNSKDQQPVNPENFFELIRIYNAMQKNSELLTTVRSVISSQTSPQFLLQLAQQLAGIRRFDLAEPVLTKYLSQKPDDSRIWIELAAVRVSRNRMNPALAAIQKAVEQGGSTARSILQKDARFRSLYNHPRFRSLVPPAAPKKQMQFDNLF